MPAMLSFCFLTNYMPVYMTQRLLFTILLLLSAMHLQAQHLLGIAGSNYGGSNAVFLNPSSIADAKQGFYLNLVGGHITFANTYFNYDGPGLQPDVLAEEYGDVLSSDGLFDRSYIRERLDGKQKMAHFGIDLRLPSFMLKLSPRHSIALTTRFRTAMQANNVSEDLARVIGYGVANPDLLNTPFTGSEAYFNTNAFSETGFTYALVLFSREKRFLKGGFTVKRLAGLYSAHLLAPEVDYQLKQTQAGESYMQVQQGNASFGFSKESPEINEKEVRNAFFGGDTPGSGWGVDIGLTYEHRPRYADYQYEVEGEERTDHGENKYRYRIGVALLDVGAITYKDPQQVSAYDITRQNLNLNSDAFEDISYNNAAQTLQEAFKVQPNERGSSIRSGLPTALHLNVDYRFTRNLFLNTAVLHNLRSKDAVGMRQYSVLAVAPRLEGRKLELAVPVYLTNNYRDLTMGAMVRLGGLTVGSNNLAAMLSSNKAVGPDLYMNLGFGIGTGGKRAKIEERARKKANKEQRKVEKQQRQAKNVNVSSVATPDSPAQAPATSPIVAPVDSSNATTVDPLGSAPVDTLNISPVDSVGNAPIDSLGHTPADSLIKTAVEPVKVMTAGSLSTPSVKPLENAQPAGGAPGTVPGAVQPSPAIKPDTGAAEKAEKSLGAVPVVKPAGAPEPVAPAKAFSH